MSNSPYLVHGIDLGIAKIDVETTDYDSGNSGSFDRHECLNNMSGINKRRLFNRQGYAYQSMTKAQTVRMQSSPSIVYSDYVYQQCRGQKPVTVNRFILTLSDQNPFDPKFTVRLDSTPRQGYYIPGYGQSVLMFNCDLKEVCIKASFPSVMGISVPDISECWDDVCEAYDWGDKHSQTFDKTEIRDWTDGYAGYGSKDVSIYRICLRSVLPGMLFNPRDPTNRNLVPDPDQEIPFKSTPDRNNTPPEKLASAYSKDDKGNYINASNRTKVCAYHVQNKPDCDNPATKTAFAVSATVAGGMVGGPIGAAVGNAYAQQLCAEIAGDGPCFAPIVNWESAFIGCVDAPIPPGPPILNAVLPITIKAVIDSKIVYPPTTPASTAGEKAADEMPAYAGKSFQELIDIRTDNSLKIGGTFDQPVIQIVTGAGSEDLFPAPLSADDAQIYNKIKLRYKFPGDTEVIDNLPRCDTINSDYLNARFCAYYDEATPDKICACIQNNIAFNDCYDPACTNSDRTTCNLTDEILGCAVRPTPNRSSIQYSLTQSTVKMSKVKVLPSQTGTNRPKIDYPSLQLRFKAWREKDTHDRVVQVGGQWFTSKAAWTLSSAVHPVNVSNIEQYTLPDVTGGNFNIPEYDFQGQSGTLENCMIVVDNNGVIQHSNYYDGHPWTTNCSYTPNISRKFYGLNFQTIIPDYDDQNKVRQTQIITPDQVLPSTTLVANDECHKNYNTCVKSYIAALDFQKCWPQDMTNLLNNSTKSAGMTMQYPVLTLPAQANARAFNRICDSLKLSKMIQKCGRDAAGNLVGGFNPSTPPAPADFDSVVSESDSEALSAYCPGLLNEEDFEDMDISRICLSYPALKWPAVNKEVMDHSYDPDLSLRTCFKSSNKVCRGYKTPKGGNLPATPPDPADTLPDDSKWTSWPRPSKATSPNNQVDGYCGAGYGVENYIQLEQNIGNFLTFTEHPGFFQSSTYAIKPKEQFCSSFTDLTMPSATATLYGPCGASESYSIPVDQLNDNAINNKITDFTTAHSACTPTDDEITAFKLALYGTAVTALNQDISSYTTTLNNAQNSYNASFYVAATYTATSGTVKCKIGHADTNWDPNACAVEIDMATGSSSAGVDSTRYPYNKKKWTTLSCTVPDPQSPRTIFRSFTIDPATFTQADLDGYVASFTSALKGEISGGVQGPNYTTYPKVWVSQKAYTWYYQCYYDYTTAAATAIQNFKNEVANQLNQKQTTLGTAQTSYLNGVLNVVQTAVANINTKCNLYYAAYSAGVTSISQAEMCNRVLAANPSITQAQCQVIPMAKKPICQKLVNDGGMPAAICNAITTDASLKTVCQATQSYTQSTCDAISEPSNPYFVLGDALVAGINIGNDVINKLNLYATSTQNITLADNSVIVGSHSNIAVLGPLASPYASYLAQRMVTANNVTLDGVTINLSPSQTTPTRTCDYTQNHRGCYTNANGVNVCQNTCVKMEGCPAITKVSDFTGYAEWPAAPAGTSDVVVQGTCQIPQDPGVSTPRPTLYRTCKAISYPGGVYRYWEDINPNDPGTAACLAASANYW